MIWNLSANDANKATLVAAGAHMRIIRAMDRLQSDARAPASAGFVLRVEENSSAGQEGRSGRGREAGAML